MSGECEKCNEHTLECKCDSDDSFIQAITVMNKNINDAQRQAFNDYHRILYYLADQIRDRMHSPFLTYRDGVLGEDLKALVDKLPWLEKGHRKGLK